MFQPGKSPLTPVSAPRLQQLMKRFDTIFDLNMPGLVLEGTTIEERAFHGCNFSRSRFVNCTIRDCVFEMCFFDFSTHEQSSYTGLELKNCLFACSGFNDVTFRSSNIIQCSFNNSVGSSLAFDDCDLFHSRLNGIREPAISIINCNLKQTRFIRANRSKLRFRHSNEEDAVFENTGGW